MIRNPACGTTLDGKLKPSKIGLVGHPGSTHFSDHPGWTTEAVQNRLEFAIQGLPTFRATLDGQVKPPKVGFNWPSKVVPQAGLRIIPAKKIEN